MTGQGERRQHGEARPAGTGGQGAGWMGFPGGEWWAGALTPLVTFAEPQLLVRIPWSPRGKCVNSTLTATSWPTRWACRMPTSASMARSQPRASAVPALHPPDPASTIPACPTCQPPLQNKLARRTWTCVRAVCGLGKGRVRRMVWRGFCSRSDPESKLLRKAPHGWLPLHLLGSAKRKL